MFKVNNKNTRTNCRSSPQRFSVTKGVLKIFTKFTGKHLCQSFFWPATLLKKKLWHRCFPVNFAKFLRTPFLQNTSKRLLLELFETNFSVNKIIALYRHGMFYVLNKIFAFSLDKILPNFAGFILDWLQ